MQPQGGGGTSSNYLVNFTLKLNKNEKKGPSRGGVRPLPLLNLRMVIISHVSSERETAIGK